MPAARVYGAAPQHVLAVVGCFAFVGYVIAVVGPGALWNSERWWQSVLIWFLGALFAHDLVVSPLSAALRPRMRKRRPKVALLNYIRVPFLGSGLLLLVIFPGIIRQGQTTTREPYLHWWLLLTAAMFGVSAAAFAVRWGIVAKRSPADGQAGKCTDSTTGSGTTG
ncbi:hypothetical protein AB0H76_08415 [Nocardia sp. NPDC050712]|uniref:hypothetical protein n=1 Tax=Nocardia sp. NPDC050712 TaxID=3155518 RepID=UPI0033C0A4C2